MPLRLKYDYGWQVMRHRQPALVVNIKDLEYAFDEWNPLKRKCKVCPQGLLLCRRDMLTGKLLDYDNCSCCGQRYVYMDIGDFA